MRKTGQTKRRAGRPIKLSSRVAALSSECVHTQDHAESLNHLVLVADPAQLPHHQQHCKICNFDFALKQVKYF